MVGFVSAILNWARRIDARPLLAPASHSSFSSSVLLMNRVKVSRLTPRTAAASAWVQSMPASTEIVSRVSVFATSSFGRPGPFWVPGSYFGLVSRGFLRFAT